MTYEEVMSSYQQFFDDSGLPDAWSSLNVVTALAIVSVGVTAGVVIVAVVGARDVESPNLKGGKSIIATILAGGASSLIPSADFHILEAPAIAATKHWRAIASIHTTEETTAIAR